MTDVTGGTVGTRATVTHAATAATAGRTVAVVPGEPAAVVFTRTAGTIGFRAALSWEGPERAPAGPLPGLSAPLRDEDARISMSEERDADATIRCLTGEVRALGRPGLGRGLERVLRAVTSSAALTEAVLEVETFRPAAPGVASPRALQELARDLWAGGFRVRFAPSWTPVLGTDVAVGGGEAVEAFLLSHPRWNVVPGTVTTITRDALCPVPGAV